MAAPENNTKLAAVKRNNHGEHPSHKASHGTNVPRVNANYKTQVLKK